MAKRIVFAVWGSLGDLHPYLAIAGELQRRGHNCVIATSNFHRPKLEGLQLDYVPLGPHFDADPDLMKRSMHLRKGPRFLLRDLLIPYTRRAFDDTMAAISGADLLVTHPITYGAHLAAQKSGIRWASTVLAPSGMFSAHDGSARSQSATLAKLERVGPWLDRALMKYARWMTEKWSAPITQARRELGLAGTGHAIFEGQFSPQLNLALFSPEFGQPQPDWPPHTVITGFPFYDEPDGVDPGLRDFLQEGEPPVVFTLGSAASMVPRKFFDASLQAVGRLQRRAVLIVGLFAPQNFTNGLPRGVAAFAYAPYGTLFSRAAVTVHHGGIGTTAQALRSGRPMLVVPFAFDQPDNAARAKRLGAARTLFIHQYTAAAATRELDALLQQAQYRERAASVGERIRAQDGVGKACEELEKLLAK